MGSFLRNNHISNGNAETGTRIRKQITHIVNRLHLPRSSHFPMNIKCVVLLVIHGFHSNTWHTDNVLYCIISVYMMGMCTGSNVRKRNIMHAS